MKHSHTKPERRDDDDARPPQRFGRRRNPLAEANIEVVTFKDVQLLKHFVTERGRIIPRRVTGVSSKQQRMIARAVKQARLLGLLPYSRPEGGP